MREGSQASDKILRDYVMKDEKKSEIFHSSGYAEAQSGKKIGTTAARLSMKERKAIEKRRQFVAKYNNSEMFSNTFSNRPEVKKLGGTEGYTPFKTGPAPSSRRPSSITPSIKPKF